MVVDSYSSRRRPVSCAGLTVWRRVGHLDLEVEEIGISKKRFLFDRWSFLLSNHSV